MKIENFEKKEVIEKFCNNFTIIAQRRYKRI